MRNIIIIFYICVAVTCTQKKADQSPIYTSPDDIAEEVKLMLHDYHKSVNNRGLMAEFDYLDVSKEFFWVPPSYSTPLSYDSVKTIVTQNAKGLEAIRFRWDSLRVYALGAEYATFTGIVKGDMTDTAGVTSQVNLIETGVAVKRQDGWKLLNGQSAMLSE